MIRYHASLGSRPLLHAVKCARVGALKTGKVLGLGANITWSGHWLHAPV